MIGTIRDYVGQWPMSELNEATRPIADWWTCGTGRARAANAVLNTLFWGLVNMVALPFLVLVKKRTPSFSEIISLHGTTFYQGNANSLDEDLTQFDLIVDARKGIVDGPCGMESMMRCVEHIAAEVSAPKDNKQKVLVYCNMGQSRSVTLLCAVLHKVYGVQPGTVLYRIRKERGHVVMNKRFEQYIRGL